MNVQRFLPQLSSGEGEKRRTLNTERRTLNAGETGAMRFGRRRPYGVRYEPAYLISV